LAPLPSCVIVMLAIPSIQTHRIPFSDIEFNIRRHVFPDCRAVDRGLEILAINTQNLSS
jgi:hypothetical protein